MFKRFRLFVTIVTGFETKEVFRKDYVTIDQVIKCAAGFRQDCQITVLDRITDHFLYCDELIAQFREDKENYED